MSDPMDPSTYRCITLASCIYKVFCNILNDRLTIWCTLNGVICDEHNGFRKDRSTIDHVSSLTSVIETRKSLRMSTFTAFIDFKKAYDKIDRQLLFTTLEELL